ncbi:MAG TPA: DUF6580 family putative transport protein [Candidatus Saccharimonadales bacterium]|nr:DUF6580 family putative transport protein [Candidatus Saccharimonadales bacterium]
MQKILEKLTNPLIFVLAAAILRVLPHAPNFAPIGAMALFSGSYLNKKTAFALPLAAMVLSDLFIGFDSWASRLTVYGAFAAITLIGFWLRSRRSVGNIILASLCASVLFFIITNFGVWAFGSLYPRTAEGLVACFTAAIPFFRNTLFGDLVYTGVFFGGYALVKNLASRKRINLAKVDYLNK